MSDLPDTVPCRLGPDHHLVFVVIDGALNQIGSLPYQHPDGTLNAPADVLAWAETMAGRLRSHPSTRLAKDAPVGVYSGDTGERLTV